MKEADGVGSSADSHKDRVSFVEECMQGYILFDFFDGIHFTIDKREAWSVKREARSVKRFHLDGIFHFSLLAFHSPPLGEAGRGLCIE